MNLSDIEILDLGDKLISPFDLKRVQPASYDLQLSPDIKIPVPYKIVDLRDSKPSDHMRDAQITEAGFELSPGSCILASTSEIISCPNDMVARVEGKSSFGRLFMAVHVTAGFVDPGWRGQITLEIVNHGPWSIMLWPFMSIAQINYSRLSRDCQTPYGSKSLGSHYQGQSGPTPAAGNRNV